MNDAKAPKARPIPAWGEAPCGPAPPPRGLKARPIAASVPQILLIAFHSILLQKGAKLILKRTLPMMHLLRVDVLDERLQICRPNRKHSVSSLPGELCQPRRLGFQPLRRRGLQLRDQPRNIRGARQSNRKVYMVLHASYAITLAPSVARDRGKIRIQLRTNGIVHQTSSVFGTEDHMHYNERERQRHGDEYRSGLQPSLVILNTPWGFAPCWYSYAPSALSVGSR